LIVAVGVRLRVLLQPPLHLLCWLLQVMEALQAVAGSINTFNNDGSFLQHFKQQTQVQQQQQQPDRVQQRQCSGSPGSSMEQDDHIQQQEQRQQRSGQPPDEDDLAPASKRVEAHASEAAAGDNRSKADLLRARLGCKPATAGPGNRSAADALRARLGGKAPPAAAEAGSKHEVVHLPLVDASGRAAPGAFGRETAADTQRALEAAAGGRVAKRIQRYGEDGKRERYFADDDNTDLQVREQDTPWGQFLAPGASCYGQLHLLVDALACRRSTAGRTLPVSGCCC
jgi:hypothetical protein